jgi:hypothetical protein
MASYPVRDEILEQLPQLTDFRSFMDMAWEHALDLPEPTPVQLDIGHWIQQRVEAGNSRIILESFRGVGKSYIADTIIPFLQFHNPDLKILILSASKKRADDSAKFTWELFEKLDVLHHLLPEDTFRASKVSFNLHESYIRTAQAPSVRSLGITGQVTGQRADVIILDDIEVLSNSFTVNMRETLIQRAVEAENVLKPKGSLVILGTPQSIETVYDKLVDRGYERRIWPARAPDAQWMQSHGHELAPMLAERMEAGDLKVGEPTDPLRYDELELQLREAGLGHSNFRLQFMLDSSMTDADRTPLKISDLLVCSVDDEVAPGERLLWAKEPEYAIDDLPNPGFAGERFYHPWKVSGDPVAYTSRIMSIDPAGRGKDETAYAVAYGLNGFIFIPELYGFGPNAGYEDETLRELARVAKARKVNLILIESNFGDGTFQQLLKPHLQEVDYPCSIEEVRAKGSKEARIIDTCEPVMNQHRLIVDRDVIIRDMKPMRGLPEDAALKYSLFYQMTRLTRERGSLQHDDRLDALEMVVKYHTEMLARHAGRAMKDRKLELLDKELRGFKSFVFGKKSEPFRFGRPLHR